MEHRPQSHEAAANGRRASSRLKLVLLGALAPVVLFALPVATVTLVGPGGETAAVTGAGSASNCESPRNAWKPVCQTARSSVARDPDVTGSVGDAPTATGAPDQKAKRRSVAGAVVTAQLDSSAAKPASEPSAQAAQTAFQAPKDMAQARTEPARPEASPTDGREEVWKDPSRPAVSTQASQAPAPSQPPSPPAPSQGELAKADGVVPEPVKAAAIPTEPAPADKPDSPKTPTAEPQGVAVNAPARSAKPAAQDTKPVADVEPVRHSSRHALRRAARPAPAVAMRERPRARIAMTRSVEKPFRLSRHRVRPVESDEVDAGRRHPVASVRRAERRIAIERPRSPRRAPAFSDGLQVTSVETYVLPDGRRVSVNVPPRPEVVRELAAYHAAAFARRAAASSWRAGWFSETSHY